MKREDASAVSLKATTQLITIPSNPVQPADFVAGVLSLVLSHPVDRLAALSVAVLARAVTGPGPSPPEQVIVTFDAREA